MAGLSPAIPRLFLLVVPKNVMPGTRPGLTKTEAALVQLLAALGHRVQEYRCLAVEEFEHRRNAAARRGVAVTVPGLMVMTLAP
jgi:hypothetical protein